MAGPKFDSSQPFETEPLRFDPSQPFEADGKQAAPTGPSKLDAARELVSRSLAQGFGQGLPDEITGAVSAVPQAVVNMLPKSLAQRLDLAQAPAADAYRAARDDYRAEDAAARAANPKTFDALRLSGAVAASLMPALRVGRGASLAASLVKNGAQGLASGIGNSTADLTQGEYGRGGVDAAAGLGAGLVTGAIGYKAGQFGAKAGEEVRLANADQAALINKATSKTANSARGELGGVVSSIIDDAKSYEHALSSPLASAEQKALAQAKLESPEFQALYRNALDNKLVSSAEDKAARLVTARNLHESAKAARAPEAISAATEEALKDPVRKQVLPRVATYATRAIPLVVGHQIGGWPGAIAGAATGAVMGSPGTSLANLVKNPAARAGLWSALEGVSRYGLEPAAKLGAQPATLNYTPDVAALLEALRQKAGQTTPEWMESTP